MCDLSWARQKFDWQKRGGLFYRAVTGTEVGNGGALGRSASAVTAFSGTYQLVLCNGRLQNLCTFCLILKIKDVDTYLPELLRE